MRVYMLSLTIITGLLSDAIECRAAVIGTSGAVSVISAPPSVADDDLESDTQVFAFPERQDTSLSHFIVLSISVPGSTPASPLDDHFSFYGIPAGTVASSYFLHCNSVDSPSPPKEFTGSITFDRDILGLIIYQSDLNSSASYLGLTGTTYSGHNDLEINRTASFDSIALSDNRRTVSFDFRNGSASDDVRIIFGNVVPGDFNNDGVANAADYVIWRKGPESLYPQGYYDVWRGNFGHSIGSGPALAFGSQASVPEPTTQTFLLASLTLFGRRRSMRLRTAA